MKKKKNSTKIKYKKNCVREKNCNGREKYFSKYREIIRVV